MTTDPVDVPEPALELGDEDMEEAQATSDQQDADVPPEAGGAQAVAADERTQEYTPKQILAGFAGKAAQAAARRRIANDRSTAAPPSFSADEDDAEGEDGDEEVTSTVDEPGSVPAVAVPAAAIHWLARIAECAGLEGERPDLPPDAPAVDAWSVVSRSYKIDDERLCNLVAEYFRLDVVDFSARDPNAVLLVPEPMARKHYIYPLYETDRHLLVATCDPTDVEAERALSFSTGRTTIFQVASPIAIQEALDARFSPEQAIKTLLDTLEADDIDDDAVKLVEEMGPESISSEDAAATPVVKLTNLVIRDAIVQGASDIHIEPGRKVGSLPVSLRSA